MELFLVVLEVTGTKLLGTIILFTRFFVWINQVGSEAGNRFVVMAS